MSDEACHVTGVDTALVSLPLERPVINPVHHITSVDNVLVTLRTDAGLEGIVEEARGYVHQGFSAMKMRAGMPRLAEDVKRFETVREAIGPDVQLMIDAVQAWTPDDAIRACHALAPFDITWIEDPVAFDDHEGMARVAAAVSMPLCAGENDYSRIGFARLIDHAGIRIAMPDLQRVGGITEWMRVAALADAHRLRVTPHAFHELSVQLMCAVPNGFWLEYVPWWERLFTDPPKLVDGCMSPPAGPGLGLEFDRNALDAHRIG